MATIVINDNLLKSIKEIAKDFGKDEETFIHDVLTDTIEEYSDCELLKRLQKAEDRIDSGEYITLEELSKKTGVELIEERI